ncbi:hypothetical protein ATANTOWER_006428 [Ataeniobius toweri]|uniref:Uncharacterized protein n=1 Tax=Ataeniobius toweri TaxID=208326 RepID=A0ABU7CEY6_9TELE|nr:hypothetical protein [Ataeniobius toweri]
MPLPRNLSSDSVLSALTQFLPAASYNHTEEPKFSFLILSRILKRSSCAHCWWLPAKRLPERSINLLKLISCVRLKCRVF